MPRQQYHKSSADFAALAVFLRIITCYFTILESTLYNIMHASCFFSSTEIPGKHHLFPAGTRAATAGLLMCVHKKEFRKQASSIIIRSNQQQSIVSSSSAPSQSITNKPIIILTTTTLLQCWQPQPSAQYPPLQSPLRHDEPPLPREQP